MPAWTQRRGHSTVLFLYTKSIFAHYLTFSWGILSLSLWYEGYKKSTVSFVRKGYTGTVDPVHLET